MKIFLSFLFLTFSFRVYAQNKKPEIKFCPLCVVDEFSFPTIQGGIEFHLSERIGLYNEIGIKYRKGYYESADTNFIGNKGYKIKTELRYYILNKKGEIDKTFIALNCFYYKDNYNTEIGYYYQGDSSISRIDNFGIRKSIYGINILIGSKKTIFNKFFVEPFGGIGARFLGISTNNKEFNKKADELNQQPIDLTIAGIRTSIEAYEKLENHLNITLGIRFCYAL